MSKGKICTCADLSILDYLVETLSFKTLDQKRSKEIRNFPNKDSGTKRKILQQGHNMDEEVYSLSCQGHNMLMLPDLIS